MSAAALWEFQIFLPRGRFMLEAATGVGDGGFG
jgi:hypothetical protein